MSEGETMDDAPKASGGADPAYQVLARRFRPTVFAEVVGQEEVLSSLRSSLEQGRLPHAFLFSGSRGVGKTTSARILARAVNCEVSPGPDPCGTCVACTSILDGSASDVIELDAASNNGVEEVRALREQAGYSPIRLRRKVFILDEVHMFSRAAFNALLKILEEPPEHVLFILATTEAHKIPETVRSRCQILPFRRIGAQDIEGRLRQICDQEGVRAADEVLAEIAASSMGGLRDAETALERILPLASELDIESYRRLVGRLGPTRAAELVGACQGGDMRAALQYAGEAVETGVDERECLGEILEVLRLLLLLRVDGKESVLIDASPSWRARLIELAASTDIETIDAMMQLLVLARDRIRHMDDRRILLELTLVRLARLAASSSLGELFEGAPAQAAPAAPAPSAAPPRARAAAAPVDRAPPSPAAPSAPSPAPSARKSTSIVHKDADPWVALVELATEEKPRLGNVLSEAQLDWKDKSALRLVFGPLKTIDRALVGSDKSRAWIEQKLSGFAGRAVSVEVEAADKAPAKRRAAPSRKARPELKEAAASEPSGSSIDHSELPPIGRKAAELFDVQHVEREDAGEA